MTQMRISQHPGQPTTQSLSPQKRTSMGVSRDNGSNINVKKGSVMGMTPTTKGHASVSMVVS